MKKSKQKEWLSTVLFFVFALAIAFAVRLFLVETIRVQGPSMEPTLYTDELVMINKTGRIERNDIVVCHFVGKTENNYIKRVIGLPGETISIEGGQVYINGARLTEDVHGAGLRPMDMEPVLIPEDHVFVMGDNRTNSSDSCNYGPVPLSMVRGKAFVVIWPIASWGLIK
ncbi:MAG: signal peptidase I [Clostridia bacterium]|nr:signal peptidase I [Clostridia bacterium]